MLSKELVKHKSTTFKRKNTHIQYCPLNYYQYNTLFLIIYNSYKSFTEILIAGFILIYTCYFIALDISTKFWDLYINKIRGILIVSFKTLLILWNFPPDQESLLQPWREKSNWPLYC